MNVDDPAIESAWNAWERFNCKAEPEARRKPHDMGQTCVTHETAQQIIPYLARGNPRKHGKVN